MAFTIIRVTKETRMYSIKTLQEFIEIELKFCEERFLRKGGMTLAQQYNEQDLEKTDGPITKKKFQEFCRSLNIGDIVFLPERVENPDTKFGQITVLKKWRVMGKYPYTVKLETLESSIPGVKTVPYSTLMITRKNINKYKGKEE